MTKIDWEINIENYAARVAEKYGMEMVKSVFKRYGATGFYNLNPCYYDEVFGDLMLMGEDS